MIEKIGHIKNPLSVIAMFAGIAEVSGAVVLPFLNPEVQGTYVWFLMGFPLVLIQLFFATLWLDHSVLYAPSDFRNDSSFLGVLRRDPLAPTVSAEVVETPTMEAAEKPEPQASAGEPKTWPDELDAIRSRDTEMPPKQEAPTATVDEQTLSFISSGRYIKAVANKLKEKLSAPYSLSQSPTTMPGLHFDVVLTKPDWNYVGKVAVVTESNWEEFLVDAQHWLNKVSLFRDSLETKDALKLQGLFGLVYSPDSISEESLRQLHIHLNGIQLQYPFGSYIQLFNVADLQA